MRATRRRSAGLFVASALGVMALAAFGPTVASAKQIAQGYIEELKKPTHVGTIASAGPGAALWFTIVGRPAAVGWMTPERDVIRYPLPAGVVPKDLVVAGGSAWFTYTRGAVAALGTAAGGIGTVTSAGKVSLFDEPPNPSGPPSELVVSTLGGLWFDHAGAFVPGGDGIGYINPTGEITEFSAGLQPGAQISKLAVADDGNIWFADTSANRAIGRITATGEITEFGGLPPGSTSFAGPSGAGSALYFSANAGPLAIEEITTGGEISRFNQGLAANAVGIGPILGDIGTGGAWFRIERHARLGTTASADGPLAIGRITAAGKISEYSRCLRPMPAEAGIRELIKGPEGNVWFANSPTGSPRHFRRLAMASIGRITPAGTITEFRFGLHPQSEPEHLLAAGRRIWFVDRHNGRIGEITPPTGPANTAQVLRLLGGKGTKPVIEVEVPGPGKLRLREIGKRPGLASISAPAPTCGPTKIAVPMSPPLVAALRRHGVVFINALLTFTPRGGSPLTTEVEIEVGVAGK